ncbi:hypothetical protein JHD49_09935, partial [Sulfurimonas sp. SAG-AH-194-C21]
GYNEKALNALIELEEEVVFYSIKNKDRWIRQYLSILNNIVACCYNDISTNLQTAIKYESKAISILKKFKNIQEQYWIDILIKRLISLGGLFFLDKSFENAYNVYSEILERNQFNIITKEKVNEMLNNIQENIQNVNYVKSSDIYIFANYLAYTRKEQEFITLKDTIDSLGFFELNSKANQIFNNIFKDSERLNNLKFYTTNEELMEIINSTPMLKCNNQALSFINVFQTKLEGGLLGKLK